MRRKIVAVDILIIFPPQIKKLQKVDYHRALDVEAILIMNPNHDFARQILSPFHAQNSGEA